MLRKLLLGTPRKALTHSRRRWLLLGLTATWAEASVDVPGDLVHRDGVLSGDPGSLALRTLIVSAQRRNSASALGPNLEGGDSPPGAVKAGTRVPSPTA